MKVTTKAVFQIDDWNLLEWEGFEYDGSVEMCKGQDVAKAQLDQQNNLQQQALDQQKAIRDQIIATTNKYTQGSGEGFDPAQLAIIQSQFLNQNSANFNQAGSSVMSSLRARGVAGGDTPAGGDFVRGLETLESARASSQSQGILGTKMADLQQALNNRFNALSVQAGQSAQIGTNIGIFGQGASNSLDQYIKAKNSPGFLSSLANGLGQGVAAVATGGLSAGMSGIAKSLGGIGKSSNNSGWGAV